MQPPSSESKWVDAEISFYQSLHKTPSIIPVYLEGEPEFAMPDALRTSNSATNDFGNVSDAAQLIGADFRDGGDSHHGAFLKVVSTLLGVPFDTLRQRERAAKGRVLHWGRLRD